MKSEISQLLKQAVAQLQSQGSLPADLNISIRLENTRDPAHGDLACNLAMMLAKPARAKPRDIAEAIVAALPASDSVDKVEIAGPGFINFYLHVSATHSIVQQILDSDESYGQCNIGEGKKVQIEFVSANPTGPLHVGHGRGAAYGATLSNLLSTLGYQVHREYYVNDAGRQMDILCASVWLRYLELCGEEIVFPANGYKGDYVWDIAASLHRENADKFRHAWPLTAPLPKDEPEGGDKEEYIDAIIEQAKTLLGDNYRFVFDTGLNYLLADIRDDLQHFGVEFDEWFSERSLIDTSKHSNTVQKAIEVLKQSDHVYEKNGALWFRSSDFGDEKDRVVVRDNGQPTYFASDIAYHLNKYERGYDLLIDIWGADHHGYVTRVNAGIQAMGQNPENLKVLLVQFAVLYRDGEKVPMSTRSGQFVTLRELRKEVGRDAARFFYVMRKCEQHLDFDLNLAKSQSNDNPVYYIQYAHARICSVFRQLEEKNLSYNEAMGLENIALLKQPQEQSLMTKLGRYTDMLQSAAQKYEPHQIAYYLRELANEFHTYYNAHQFLVEDEKIRQARLALINASRHVIANGLKILGVSAPQNM
ncbi:arginine--tRNA ligase [Beggiatoa alba]|nr:arginine--tRNA ligase [Beggiatoa alba]